MSVLDNKSTSGGVLTSCVSSPHSPPSNLKAMVRFQYQGQYQGIRIQILLNIVKNVEPLAALALD